MRSRVRAPSAPNSADGAITPSPEASPSSDSATAAFQRFRPSLSAPNEAPGVAVGTLAAGFVAHGACRATTTGTPSPRPHAVKAVLLWRVPATARGSCDGDTLAYAAVSPTIAALPVSLIRVRDAATPATSAIVLPRMRCADDCQLRRRFQHRPIQQQLELIGR
jgi:hypothetical protein